MRTVLFWAAFCVSAIVALLFVYWVSSSLIVFVGGTREIAGLLWFLLCPGLALLVVPRAACTEEINAYFATQHRIEPAPKGDAEADGSQREIAAQSERIAALEEMLGLREGR